MQTVFKDMLVLELASVLAGPSVGQFFAELGARVLKIENAATHGDVTRTWKLGSEPADTDTPAYFCAANWGKTSLALNLALSTDLQQLYGLVAKADLVIASYKPGDAEKLQVDYKTLQRINPTLIYGHITGYGASDTRAGYDAVVQAESGFMYLNGEPSGPPVKMPVALMDILTAHQLKEGLLVALLQRQQSGKGQLVHVSLLQAAVSALANQATNYLVAGHEPQRMGSEHPTIVPYGSVFTCNCGKQMVMAIGNNRQFRRLCAILQAEELADDPRFSNNTARVLHRQEINSLLAALIAKRERETLLRELHAQHVPAGALHTIPEVFAMPQAQQMLLQHEGEKPGIRQIAFELQGHKRLPLTPPPHYPEQV